MADDPRIARLERIAAAAAAKGNKAAQAKAEAMLAELRDAAPTTPAPVPTSTPEAPPVSITQAVTKPPGKLDQVGQWLGRGARALGNEVVGVGTMIGSGLGLMEPDAEDVERLNRLETIGERASNAITVGASRPIMDLLGTTSPQRREQLERAYPRSALVGDVLGHTASAIRGPAALIDQTVRGVAQRVAPLVVPRAMQRAAPGTTETLAEAATGGLSGVLEGVAANRSLEGSGTNAIIGASGAPLARGARAAEDLIEHISPWVGSYRRGVSQNAYQGPAGVPTVDRVSTRDGRQAAENAAEGFARRNDALESEGVTTLAAERAPYLQNPMSRRAIFADIHGRLRANQDSQGRPIDPILEAELGGLIQDLGPLSVRGPGGRMQANPDPTYADLIARRAALRREAGFESPDPTDAQRRARLRYDVLREAIQRNAPAEALAAEARAAEGAGKRRRERDIVYNTEGDVSRGGGGDPDLRVSKEKAGATFFGRVGDTNVPGQSARRYLDELSEADPEYAEMIRYVERAKARDATALSTEPLVPTNLAGAAGPASLGAHAQQIGRFIGGRLAIPALVAGRAVLPRATPRLVPFLRDPTDAIEEGRRRKEREKKNAQ